MLIDHHPIPENEPARINALRSYHILDTLPEKDFDAITRLAAYICKCPIALVSLVDTDRLFFKSRVGFSDTGLLRSEAFCRFTILHDDVYEIPDMTESEIFASNPLVTGDSHVRFYAGAPLIDDDGFKLGSLCVIDSVPRTLDDEQKEALQTLANEVISHLTLRRKKIELENSLKIHTEFFNLFNNSPEIHCVMDRDTKIELINDSVTRILGYAPEEAKGRPIWYFFAEEEREANIKKIEEGLKNNIKSFESETRIITRSGEIKWISWSVNTKSEHWYASGRDITYQKKVSDELELLSLVASKVSNGVVISNADNKVVWINSAFEKITGYTIELLKEKHLGDVIRGELTDISIIEKARELSRNKQSYEVDLLIYRRDGQPLWASVINSIILDAQGNVDKYVEVIIDITAKKRAELELMAAKEQALQLNRAKDMFIGVMSHEIRTPLNAVIGISHLLMDDSPNESQKENLSILKFSADNLMTLINDVLDFTKVETGNIELEKVDVDLRELVHSVLSSMQFKAQDKAIYLRDQIDHRVPEYVLGDKTRLVQILLNLIGNSVKFTKDGGITVSLNVIEETIHTVVIHFEISDTGIGIPSSKIETIFESFKQADSNTTRLYGGTGLGLAITKRLVELHHSRIVVESVYGQGSNFSFDISFEKSQKIDLGIKTSDEPTLKIKVLVVDDNRINRLLINKVVNKWGVITDFAENGLIAIEKLEEIKDYDVVLMDIHMPEMGGLEASKVIRSKADDYYKQIPIIALTASMMSNQMDQIYDAGMNDYMLKPFEPKTLYEKISKYAKHEQSL